MRGLVAEELAQLLDARQQLLVLLLDLVALEAGEPLEAQVEDRLRLRSRELERVHERVARRVDVGRLADDADDLVEVVERDQEALEDVRPRLGLVELELGAPDDDLVLEGDVGLEHLEQRERARHAADQGDVDDAEGGLQLGVLVELVEHHLGMASRLSSMTSRMPVRSDSSRRSVISAIFFVLDQLGDLVDERGAVHLVGQLGDDDARCGCP